MVGGGYKQFDVRSTSVLAGIAEFRRLAFGPPIRQEKPPRRQNKQLRINIRRCLTEPVISDSGQTVRT